MTDTRDRFVYNTQIYCHRDMLKPFNYNGVIDGRIPSTLIFVNKIILLDKWTPDTEETGESNCQ
jgi:hypothetical protein